MFTKIERFEFPLHPVDGL